MCTKIDTDTDGEMSKFGVDESVPQAELEKAAAHGCPKCGRAPIKHGSVLICPECGSAPFEKEK